MANEYLGGEGGTACGYSIKHQRERAGKNDRYDTKSGGTTRGKQAPLSKGD